MKLGLRRVSKYNTDFKIERVRKERDEWRECCERLICCAPIQFSEDVNWLKALLYVKKIVLRSKQSIVEQ
jgi:hypothetical protein